MLPTKEEQAMSMRKGLSIMTAGGVLAATILASTSPSLQASPATVSENRVPALETEVVDGHAPNAMEVKYGTRASFPACCSGWRGASYPYQDDPPERRSTVAFRWDGDVLYARDDRRDGLSAAFHYYIIPGGRHGICVNRFTRGTTVKCNVDFDEDRWLIMCGATYDVDTGTVRYDIGDEMTINNGVLLHYWVNCHGAS
jgi:hypothetical protein